MIKKTFNGDQLFFGSERVRSNLLQQNCFVRDVVKKKDVLSPAPSSFVSLNEVPSSNGVNIVTKLFPYHITPEYVSSFIESSDYRSDPLSFKRVSSSNLGDMVSLQRLASMDTPTLNRFISDYKASLAKSPNPEPKPEPKPELKPEPKPDVKS